MNYYIKLFSIEKVMIIIYSYCCIVIRLESEKNDFYIKENKQIYNQIIPWNENEKRISTP